MADDVLRQIPSFSLFRRANSISAQPTTQGVSLRGIGPSGQSRTLVLLDGIPFNDPFGGWVYWTRVPLDQRGSHRGHRRHGVEPVRQLRDGRRHQHRDQPADAAHGRDQAAVRQSRQPEVRLVRQRRVGQAGRSVEGSFFNTDGFPIVHRRARADRQQRQREVPERQRQGSSTNPTDRFSAFLPRGLLHRGPRQRQGRRGQRHELDDGEAAACAMRLPDCERPPGARVRATCRRRTSTSSR